MVKENERFFDSFEYSEAEFAEYMQQFMLTGVDRTYLNVMAVSAPGGMQVRVAGGRAWVQGFFYNQPTALNITVDPNDEDDVRRDYVTLRVQRNLNNFLLFVNKGTAAPTPDPPDMERSMSYYDIVLAYVDVPIGASSITTGMIHDLRGNTDFCGWSGYGVFPDYLAQDADIPGVAFQTDPNSGLGWDGENSRMLIYVSGVKPIHFYTDAVVTPAHLYSSGEPAFATEWKNTRPPVFGDHLNTAAGFWDRRYQLVLGRSAITTISSVTARRPVRVWGLRVGVSGEGNASGALELFDTMNAGDIVGYDVPTRPDTSEVPLAFDIYGQVFLYYPNGAYAAGPNYYHRFTVSEPRANRSGINVTERSLVSATYNNLSLVPRILTAPTTPVAGELPTKRVPAAREGAMGLLYGDGPPGAIPSSNTALFIGPEGAAANGIRMDYLGQVGLGMLPAYPFDVTGIARFNSEVRLEGVVKATDGSISVESSLAIATGTAQSLSATGSLDIGTSQSAGAVSLEVRRNAIFYGDVNIRGNLTFGSGGGGTTITFPADVTVTGILTVNGNGWFKSALRVDGDLDVYGFVRFHKGASQSPWSFNVAGAQYVQGTFRAGSPIEAFSNLYFGVGNSSSPRVIGSSPVLTLYGSQGVGLRDMTTDTGCSWLGNWHSDERGAVDTSVGNLGLFNSRWGRLFSLYAEDCNETSGLSLLSMTGAVQVEEPDGQTFDLPGVEVIGLRAYSPEEGLQAAMATPIATYFVSNSSAVALNDDPEVRGRLMESASDMELNVMSGQLPKELSPSNGGIRALSVALVAISAAQALQQRNQELEQRISSLEQLVASFIPPAQA